MENNNYKGINPYAVYLIRKKARQLMWEAGFKECDLDDLEQDLMMDLLQRLPKYDPERSQIQTFIDRVVRHKVATLIEAQMAKIRDYKRLLFSFNDLIEDAKGECTERLEIFDQAEYLRRTGNLSLSPSEVRNLSIDLNKVLEGLPPELRALCKRLETETITEISQSTGVPRTTIYDSIKTIRAILEKAALQEYL